MIDITAAKRSVTADFAPGHPGREAILSLPDRLQERTFDETFPLLVRLLRTPAGGRPGVGIAGTGGPTDGSGRPRK